MTQRHKMSKCCWKNRDNRLTPHTVVTNLPFLNYAVSVKHNKMSMPVFDSGHHLALMTTPKPSFPEQTLLVNSNTEFIFEFRITI